MKVEVDKVWPDFETLEYSLIAASTPFSASYVHGMIAGVLCVNGRQIEKCKQLIEEKIPEMNESHGRISELINNLFSLTALHLQDQNYELTLMLAPDDLPMPQRLETLANWCQGFLEGVEAENLPKGTLIQYPMVSEVLEDFMQIKDLSFETPSTQENEKDYMEIVEFVRVGALLVHAECTQTENGPSSAQHLH
ncbi:MAG: hypothetical protein BGO43_12775 [Gammaproteobacteria bacterium 39-13]|nr:UPF0149 family protein [Gammaproteobacteria bacterium]OJV91070.1 MAG: hypothetical protein BGO43_12775 [Gammaproteobacteria bacterium 39-13]